MRFLVDECVGPTVARWLRQHGHEVFSAYDEARGLSDDDLLERAAAERWILLTGDKDFGEMVFRQRLPHRGVVLLRLEDQRAMQVIAVLRALLADYGDRLEDTFAVVTETKVRFRF